MSPRIRVTTPVHILLLLLMLLMTHASFGQRLDYEDKLYFADSVRKIKLWTYIEGDKSFRRYRDAVESATKILNKKGYIVEDVIYKNSSDIPAQLWMNNMIQDLRRNEALLVISTQVTMSNSIAPANPMQTRVLDENGANLLSHQYLSALDTTWTTYSSNASSRLFVNWNKPSRTALVPVYSRIEKVHSADIALAVKYTLSAIPASKHPTPGLIPPDTLHNGKVPIEICLFGGYTLPSTMKVDENSGSDVLYPANFGGNFHYGLEISIGISKSVDLNFQYRRLGTSVDVKTPLHENTGSVLIYQNYALFGASYNFRVSKMISPYAGISAGGVDMVPSNDYYLSIWYFDLAVQGGVKFYLSRRFGIRLQADLNYQVHPKHASFLYSDDVRHNVPVDAMSNMPQLGFSAGVILRLDN